MPRIKAAEPQSLGVVLPQIATGNTTVLFQTQKEAELTDAEKAVLVVVLTGFGLGGKKVDNSVVLTPGYTGKLKDGKKVKVTGCSGAFVGDRGYLHHFLQGNTLWKTLWYNQFSLEEISKIKFYPKGLGVAPWEKMPKGEDDAIAKDLKQSLIGHLVPLSKFFLIDGHQIHYSDGIVYPSSKEGGIYPGVPYTSENKVLWVNPEKQPWRNLSALLGFLSQEKPGYSCLTLSRIRTLRESVSPDEEIAIWAGGLKTSSNSGEQYASGKDDFVDSTIRIVNKQFGEHWFNVFKQEMLDIDLLSKIVYKSTQEYFEDLGGQNDQLPKVASNLFWQLCDTEAQSLIDACASGEEQLEKLRNTFWHFCQDAYNRLCPKETARQLTSWAENRPKRPQKNMVNGKEKK